LNQQIKGQPAFQRLRRPTQNPWGKKSGGDYNKGVSIKRRGWRVENLKRERQESLAGK